MTDRQQSVRLRHRDDVEGLADELRRFCFIERIEKNGRAIGWNMTESGKTKRFRSYDKALAEAFVLRYIHPIPVNDLAAMEAIRENPKGPFKRTEVDHEVVSVDLFEDAHGNVLSGEEVLTILNEYHRLQEENQCPKK